ncbi:MAG: hypothetical protein UY07_C0014G0015 [Parcubacteria group bacterium GW2011_GWA1_47_8]|uniref:Uncharacterized protein n=1 Tax=Candidatus Gottesmanbacteria bacterium GW2011_GWA2_42_18 TaxID=1618442 RepID=A0A0G0ZBY0_9BACT|nr:MAG: hypothetical protein UV09_C0020G0012 [Candidatus Gottesmanbacteria bacterium GW2011_GWA2_42_18]KKU81595.1 MAG: hypothetical protein UY07_C0014G0015 [Parcubacteria group bacterium GW2011_GWA1_47_8]
MKMHSRIMAIVVFCSVLFFITPDDGYAQVGINDSSVTSTYTISDENVAYGDIISFNKEEGTYVLSRTIDDKSIFGVVVEQPVLLFHRKDGAIPIVQSGEVLLNVTTANGPIAAGDDIIASAFPGKGQKADIYDANVVAVARESFTGVGGTNTATFDGEEIAIGQIKAVLAVGVARSQKPISVKLPFVPQEKSPITRVIQYLVAAIIAIGSVYLSFRNFMPNIHEGIASIGRNPRAKASIQSMVILNAALIIVVSAAGFAVSIIIILLPF